MRIPAAAPARKPMLGCPAIVPATTPTMIAAAISAPLPLLFFLPLVSMAALNGIGGREAPARKSGERRVHDGDAPIGKAPPLNPMEPET